MYTNILEVRDLKKSYKDFTLGPISFDLPKGCIMGLIGENGAGKSTVIKLILDLVNRDEGTVNVLGRENRDNFKAVKEEIGVVFDNMGIPNCLTPIQTGIVMKNSYRNWDSGKWSELLNKFGIPLKTKFGELSSGNKMKLSIAVALSHNPKLLILDEATNGLDPIARDNVVNILNEFTRDENHGILISSHIVSDLEKLCDYIGFIHKGQLLLCEEKDRLLERYGILQCKSQQLDEYDSAAVVGCKEGKYGVEAIMERSEVPSGLKLSPVSIEDLFVFMIKEEK